LSNWLAGATAAVPGPRAPAAHRSVQSPQRCRPGRCLQTTLPEMGFSGLCPSECGHHRVRYVSRLVSHAQLLGRPAGSQRPMFSRCAAAVYLKTRRHWPNLPGDDAETTYRRDGIRTVLSSGACSFLVGLGCVTVLGVCILLTLRKCSILMHVVA
jgi:hypothetical protein